MVPQKKIIPFRSYRIFIIISILFIIAISVVIYANFIKDNKYDFPFIKLMKNGKEIVRIYPASSFDNIVMDDVKNLTFNTAKNLINKSFSYKDISDYNFGQIDHYVESGVYKVYNRFDNNYITLYEEDKKIVGLTYKYIYNKSGTTEFPEREHTYQEIARLEKIIGTNYTVEKVNDRSKNFITNREDGLYVLTIISNDISGDSMSDILNKNDQISLNISLFNNMDSYKNTKVIMNNN